MIQIYLVLPIEVEKSKEMVKTNQTKSRKKYLIEKLQLLIWINKNSFKEKLLDWTSGEVNELGRETIRRSLERSTEITS